MQRPTSGKHGVGRTTAHSRVVRGADFCSAGRRFESCPAHIADVRFVPRSPIDHVSGIRSGITSSCRRLRSFKLAYRQPVFEGCLHGLLD